jgi:hypothetical protein
LLNISSQVLRFGEILASLVAPKLYKESGGSTLPMMCVALVLCLACLLFWSTTSRSRGEENELLNKKTNVVRDDNKEVEIRGGGSGNK